MFNPVTVEHLPDLAAQRVCLIKPSAFGDVVQTLPVLHALRRRFPHAHLAWVVNRNLIELLSGHPDLDEIIAFDRRGTWRNWRRFAWSLRRRRFDVVFDLQGLLRTGVMSVATGASVRVGLQTAREGAHLAYHYQIAGTDRQRPAHARYWQLAEALGVADVPRINRISVPAATEQWAAVQCEQLAAPVLAVHPGARWATKRWPIERFAAVASKAVRRFGYAVALVGTAEDGPLGRQFGELLRKFAPSARLLDLTGATSLKQLAALLANVQCLLTNDSGPMHLAAALGTPVVGIFTCTDPLRSGPPGAQHELVVSRVDCAASYRKVCPYAGCHYMACMQQLEVQEVWDALQRVISKNQLTTAA